MQERNAEKQGPVLFDVADLKTAYRLLLQEASVTGEAMQKMMALLDKIAGHPSIHHYSLAIQVTASLSDFLPSLKILNTLSCSLIKAHIDALYVIFQDNITGEGDDTAKELLKELTTATTNYTH